MFQNIDLFLLQIWEVLTNDEVVTVVSSVRNRSKAAKVLVAQAVQAWRTKYPGCIEDDCTVVCLFFKDVKTLNQPELNMSKSPPRRGASSWPGPAKHEADVGPATTKNKKDSSEEWNILEAVTCPNSLFKVPRLSSILRRRKSAKRHEDTDEVHSISILQ